MSSRQIDKKISQFRTKYYFNLILKGILISILSVLSVWSVSSVSEYFLYLPTVVRISILLSIVLISAYLAISKIAIPLYLLGKNRSGADAEKLAIQIGKYFPEVDDKLLNFLQLQQQDASNALVHASLERKAQTLSAIEFNKAINYRESIQYFKYFVIIILAISALYLFRPSILSEGSERIINYNNTYTPKAPFSFEVVGTSLTGFLNEDLTVEVKTIGNTLPQEVFILDQNRRVKMNQSGIGVFTYTYQKIKTSKKIQFEAAGYTSEVYTIVLNKRPSLGNFNITLQYPKYTKKPRTRLENTGNLIVPEGTLVTWDFNAKNTESLALTFYPDSAQIEGQKSDNQIFNIKKRVYKNAVYEISIQNEHSSNKDKIQYSIQAIADQYPSLELKSFQDTTLFDLIVFGGNIGDDYGLSAAYIRYEIKNQDQSVATGSLDIKIDPTQNNQSFFYEWQLDTLQLKGNQQLSYFVEVFDNDGIHGPKSTKSQTFNFNMPTRESIDEQIKALESKTENSLDQRLKEASELKKKIEKADNKLKGKKELNWQDEKLLEDILKQKQELNKELRELQNDYNSLNEKQERFDKKSEAIEKQLEQIKQLMEDVLDEDTQKLYDELQKLLEEQKDIEQIQDLLKNIDNKEKNLEQELERTLELFKRMKFEQELQENIDKLKELGDKQENLSEESLDKNNEQEFLSKEQEAIQQEFEKLKEEMKSLEKLNEDLKSPNSMPDQSNKTQEIDQGLEKTKQELQNNKRKKASDSQKDTGKKMKKMAKSMESMQSSMQMQQMQENMENLKNIMHNLITLSFNQESLMKKFRSVDQSDPRFIDLAQEQVKLRDDANIIEDSLLSLSNRVFQIASFVTREVSQMNGYMEESSKAIKERKKGVATGKQQLAMTSMNNLALMLDDTMDQMQQQMADAMGMSKGKKDGNTPSMSDLQKQLNNKMEELQKSGKSGRQLSQELAKMAAEQEKIRRMLEEMEKKLNSMNKGEGGGSLGDIIKKMEKTEMDLVNKNITKETIKRQKQITTRLLETEKAMREKELDQERKGETAKDNYQKNLPKSFEDYFKQKEKEIELYKTVPIKLLPFYKKEVNQYFKRIGEK